MKTLLALKLLTWNIGQAYFDNAPYETRAWDKHFAHIAEFVKAEAPDAFCAQEFIDKAQMERLKALLPGYALYPTVTDPNITDRTSALFLKEDGKAEVLEMEGGKFAAAVIRDGKATLACVHLSGFNQERRKKQVQSIVDWAGKAAGEVFVMGDMNFAPTSLEYANMTAAFTDASKGVGATHATGNQIDYIFVRTVAKPASKARAVVGQRRGLMDHTPVAAEITLEKP